MILNIRELKSELITEIIKSNKVFIIGHKSPDFDSIASCIGIQKIASTYGEAYIIVDDDASRIEAETKKIIDNNRTKYNIINKNQAEKLIDSNSLLIVVDTNKEYMISVENILDRFRNILIIDHHEEDEHTIKTKSKYIFHDISSVSEIVAILLDLLEINYDSDTANYLYAGIRLDTKRFRLSTTSNTHKVAERLISKGADICYVNSLFPEDFESFCRISNLIVNGMTIKKYSESTQVAFALNKNIPKFIYLKEDLAKTADKMIDFNGIDASFVLGYIDEGIIHISARGGKKVNVGRIMKEIKGGGNAQSAGGQIKSDDIIAILEELMKKVPIGINEEKNKIKILN